MIICPNCGRENADHYKFCLGCGTELKGGGAAKASSPVDAPQLGRAGRKLRLDSPLFGSKRPGGGLGGLGGLSRKLGSSKAEGDEQPGDEVDTVDGSGEEERDTTAGHAVSSPPGGALDRAVGRLAPAGAGGHPADESGEPVEMEPESAEADAVDAAAVRSPSAPSPARVEAGRGADALHDDDDDDDDDDGFDGEIEDADDARSSGVAKPGGIAARPAPVSPARAAGGLPGPARPGPIQVPPGIAPASAAQAAASSGASAAAGAAKAGAAAPRSVASPAASRPAPIQAAAAGPGRPAPVQPGAAQPGAAQPGAAQPGAAQPGAVPAAARPAAQPVAAQPAAAQPAAAQPAPGRPAPAPVSSGAAPSAAARPAAVRPASPAVIAPARPVGAPPGPGRAAPPAPAGRGRAAEPSPIFDDDAPDDSVIDDAPPPMPAGRGCHACGAVVPQGFKFCGVCGTRYDAPQPESPAGSHGGTMQGATAPSAHLVLIHPDGTEGEIFPLTAGETTVGRAHPSSIFAEDPFLSPRHATFYFVQGQLYVRDEGSLNGVFLRIRAEVELFHWDMFRIGQQLLRFEEMSQVRPIMPGSGDGTTVMGSPMRGTWGRLASVVALDTTTSVWPLRKPEVYLGRERGELVFPEDGFVSGSHCKLAMRRGRCFLGDLDSTNGTYLRIKGEGIVTRGDLLLLGQQLFKIELNR